MVGRIPVVPFLRWAVYAVTGSSAKSTPPPPWQWISMKPGVTKFPCASMSSGVSSGGCPPPTIVMIPFSMPMNPWMTSLSVIILPFLMYILFPITFLDSFGICGKSLITFCFKRSGQLLQEEQFPRQCWHECRWNPHIRSIS